MLAHYRLVRQVGAGGMGVVYLARDVDLDRDVALKLLRIDPSASSTGAADAAARSTMFRERFLREARTAARLNHPNVAQIYQVGRQDELIFLAQEWLDGGSLADHLKESVFLSWREATLAIRDAAAGLAAAHAAGLIHRDIKPSNLMRARGGAAVKLVDFGLARDQNVESELTQSGMLVGTPAYLSPEQCRGEEATPLSDLYSLACTWFHLLTSRAPFPAANVAAILYEHLNKPLPDPRRFADDIPEAVSAILARAAAKAPGDRHPSAEAFLAEVNALLEDREAVPPTIVAARMAPGNAGVLAGNSAPRANAGGDTGVSGTPPNNLPEEMTSFIGRTAELTQTVAAIRESRLSTLIGPGGTGKTRLAIRAAREATSHFPDGVWLIELASLPATEAVAPAIAAVLHLRESAGQPLADAIIEKLRETRTLLVLDNCEHVIDSAANLVAKLLAACPDVKILATSRQPLKHPAEVLLQVAPLALPTEENQPLAELEQVEAVRLFVDRARAARPGFAITAENAPAIAQICRRLDGMPLALELAAARIKLLSAQQIAQRLGDAFRLLAGGARTLLPRQQTLRALIDWSHELLSPTARTVLARVGIFAGGCTMEAAEAIVADDELEPEAVLDAIAELVDQSLLISDERDGIARYRMLETIRQYAAEKLAASGEQESLRTRHAAHFAYMAADSVARLHSPLQSQIVSSLTADMENLRAALDGAIGARDLETAVSLGASLGKIWFLTGSLAEGLQRLGQILALNPPPSARLARLLDALGVLALHFGEPDKAKQRLEAGLTMARSLGRADVEASILRSLGNVAKEQGDLTRAFELTKASLESRVAAGDRPAISAARNNLGLICKAMGDVENARRYLQGGLEISRELGDFRWVAYGDLNLGELELDLGNVDVAKPLYESSLRLLQELKEDWGAAYALEGLGKCARAAGDLATARQRFEQTLAVAKKYGDKSTVADQLDQLAELALAEHDDRSAAGFVAEAAALRLKLKEKLGLAATMELRAAVLAESNPRAAARLLGCAAAQRITAGGKPLPSRKAWLEKLTAKIHKTLGDAAFAEESRVGEKSEPGELLK
jgi:non-specific serine/threonine protein kinase